MEETKTGKIGKIIKIILTVALFVFIGALVFRMCQSSHKALDEVIKSEGFTSASESGDGIKTHAINDEFSKNGAVYAYSLIYIEEQGYLQFTVRYNKRHIDEVRLTYPDFKNGNIRYELYDASGKAYTPTILAAEEKYNYSYFRLEFTGVDFSTKEISIKMILDGIDINVGENSTLVIHRKDDTYIPYSE